jgi:hypothetical protein
MNSFVVAVCPGMEEGQPASFGDTVIPEGFCLMHAVLTVLKSVVIGLSYVRIT